MHQSLLLFVHISSSILVYLYVSPCPYVSVYSLVQRWSVVVLVLLIAGGLLMFTYKYTQFNLFGFLLVMTASLLRFVSTIAGNFKLRLLVCFFV